MIDMLTFTWTMAQRSYMDLLSFIHWPTSKFFWLNLEAFLQKIQFHGIEMNSHLFLNAFDWVDQKDMEIFLLLLLLKVL
jgi:hypothetical protein